MNIDKKCICVCILILIFLCGIAFAEPEAPPSTGFLTESGGSLLDVEGDSALENSSSNPEINNGLLQASYYNPKPPNGYIPDWVQELSDKPEINEYLSRIILSPYSANKWHIMDYDGDGYEEYFLLTGENYHQWSFAGAAADDDSYIKGFGGYGFRPNYGWAKTPWDSSLSYSDCELRSAYSWQSKSLINPAARLETIPVYAFGAYTTGALFWEKEHWKGWGWPAQELFWVWQDGHKEYAHVLAMEPDFSLKVSPAETECYIPDELKITIDISEVGNFTAPVNLSCSGLPAEVSYTFSQNPVRPPASIVMTLYVPDSVQAGKYNLTVFGSFGDDIKEESFVLKILERNPPNIPNSPFPQNQASGQPRDLLLKWSGGDLNPDGLVKYDIFFGTTENPGLAAENSLNSTYNPGLLETGTTYYWKVIAKNSYGLSTEGETWSFTTNAPPNKPTVVSPPDKVLLNLDDPSLFVNLSWGCSDPDSEDSLSYDIYFGRTKNPPLLPGASNISTNYFWEYDPYMWYDETFGQQVTCYWKVVARDSSGESVEGDVWEFPLNYPPRMVGWWDNGYFPDHSAEGQPLDLNLSWTCREHDPGDSLSYDLYFGPAETLDAYGNPPLLASNITGTSYNPGHLKAGTTYYWKVIAKDEHGTSDGQWNVLQFTTDMPPKSPVEPYPFNNSVDQPVSMQLSWICEDPEEEDTLLYDIYFGTEKTPPKIEENFSNTGYALDSLEYGTRYYWKIIAKDSQGLSNESKLWNFITEAPSNGLIFPNPENRAGGQSTGVTLSWVDDSSWLGAEPGPETEVSYELYLGKSRETLSLLSGNHSDTWYEPAGLDFNCTYYWKVVAKDSASGLSFAGPVWSFTTKQESEILCAPHPENHATGLALNTYLSWFDDLSWTDAEPWENTVSYEIYLGEEKNPSLIAKNLSYAYYSEAELKELEPGTTYYWKVIAKDGDGNSVESVLWDFSTEKAPGVPSDPVPENQAIRQKTDLELSWSAVDLSEAGGEPGAEASYDLYFGSAKTPDLLVRNLTERSYSLEDLEWNRTYYWKIVAKDSSAVSVEGDVWAFTTNPLPILPENPYPENHAVEQPQTLTLNWSEVDLSYYWVGAEPGSISTAYAVYFGTTKNPELVAWEWSDVTYGISKLEPNSTYYWKVSALDLTHGVEYAGPLWNFTTNSAPSGSQNEILGGIIPPQEINSSWNPYQSPASPGAETVITSELQDAVYCWFNNETVLDTGTEVNTEELQTVILAWLNDKED